MKLLLIKRILLPLCFTFLSASSLRASILANTEAEPRRVVTIQVLLARQGFGCGLADNRTGNRTRGALADFMEARKLATEEAAWAALSADTEPIFGRYAIRPADLASLGRAPADWEEASRESVLAFEALPELLAETFCVSQPFLNVLNPGVDWSTVTAGVNVVVLNWHEPPKGPPASRVEIDTERFRLRVFDTNNVLMLSFPCSVARDRTRIPAGSLKMVVFAPNPDYTFNPANYPESARAREIGHSLLLPPGPNSPVGVYWIGLDRPGFGIHGTPHPESIGCMESHGCFRLMNRDILTLSRYVKTGTPVTVRGTGPATPAARPRLD
jgi:lipoprotein-anchoring transpeptidase ErfK/SrfK